VKGKLLARHGHLRREAYDEGIGRADTDAELDVPVRLEPLRLPDVALSGVITWAG
jgi:hypothetical protein